MIVVAVYSERLEGEKGVKIEQNIRYNNDCYADRDTDNDKMIIRHCLGCKKCYNVQNMCGTLNSMM